MKIMLKTLQYLIIAIIIFINYSDGQTQSIIAGTMGLIVSGLSMANKNTQMLSEEGPNRNVVIEISNHLRAPLTGGSTFLQWGLAKYPAPTVIAKGTREVAVFYKVSETATGTAGSIAYRTGNESDVAYFAIIWSVPFNYIHASNWFGLRFISKHANVNWKIFAEAWFDETWSTHEVLNEKSYRYARDNKAAVIIHNDYVISATMSDYGRSIIKVAVQQIQHKDKRQFFQ